MRISDWSSDVCSSDLPGQRGDFRVDLVDFEQGKLTDVGAGCRGAGPEGQQAVDILERKASLLGTLDKSDAPNRFLFEASIPVRIAASRYDQRSEEHTSELQSLMSNSYAVFCLKNNR